MTIVPTPEVATLSALTQMQGEVLLAKAKVDLKTMEVQLKKLERELNPPNPLEELAAAGITLPPNLIAGARPAPAGSNPLPVPANLASPVVQALQAILPVPDKTDQPPKLLLIRGKDVILEAVFEVSEDGPAPAPGAPTRDRITPPGRQITVTVGEELPGKWVVQNISHSTVAIAQRGKLEQLILRPGDYLPIRYTEPGSTRSAKPKSAPTSLRPAGAKPAAATPAAARPTAPAKTSAPSRGSTSKGATDAKRAPAKPAKPPTYDDDNSG